MTDTIEPPIAPTAPAPAAAESRQVALSLRGVTKRYGRFTAVAGLDLDVLRGEINAERPALSAAQTAYHDARNEIRETLRQELFNAAALRETMARTRAARQKQDQILQDLFADAASKMSRAGRLALADWPPNRKPAGQEH